MAAATMYVTVDGGAAPKDGSDWAHAMDLANWFTDVTTNAEAGDTYYLYSDGDDVYAPTAALNTEALNGTVTAPISIIGVSDQETPPTEATGSNRPTLAFGSYRAVTGDYWIHRGLLCTQAAANHMWDADEAQFINCKMTRTGGRDKNCIRMGRP